MSSTWRPSESELEGFARLRIAYEVRTLRAQLEAMRGRNGGTIKGPIGLALLETVFVHRRLLDDFLGSEPRHDDVGAGHYLPTWSYTHFLQNAERDAINAQVADLAGRGS